MTAIFTESEYEIELSAVQGPAGASQSVNYVAQSLTTEQKTQARDNIDALAKSIGSTANLPLITTTSGVITVGSFGTSANTFCQGNDVRVATIFVPNQTDFSGSYALGNGLRSLEHASNEEGWDNIAIGNNAGLLLEDGWGNTLIGTNCGRYMEGAGTPNGYTGGIGNVGNTFVGRSAGAASNGALDNTAIGVNCCLNLTDGMDNTAAGINSLQQIAGGSENVSIGHGAFQYVVGDGDFATGNGHRLTAVGDQAARFLNSGSNKTGGKSSVYIGGWITSLSNSAVNENVFGYGAQGAGDNSVVIGNDSVTKTVLKGFVEIGGNATTRIFSLGGSLYIESDGGIYLRDTSTSAALWHVVNDGRTFSKTGVWHADTEGNDRVLYNTAGGATQLAGSVQIGSFLNIGNAGNRIFQDSGNLYLESDGGIYLRDTSSSATLWTVVNDGRTFSRVGVWHADSEGNERVLYNGAGGATQFWANVIVGGLSKLGNYTAATLPSAAAYAGYECNVTDSSVATFGSTVAGGGSNNVKVRSNGTNWTVTGI